MKLGFEEQMWRSRFTIWTHSWVASKLKVLLDPLEKLEANSGEIQLVFHHLISNAYQAMSEKSAALSLAIRPMKDGIEIKVSDDGVGISPGYLNQIFDPFFTTRKVEKGKGLGLNIVYRIITKYQGVISAESKEYIGTTFTIQLPIRRNP